MYILSVETVTKAGSLALLKDEEVLKSQIGDESISHSVNLIKDIDEILRTSKVKKNEIQLLAAATGPGSFTGLRIGLSTVKGLAKALKIPAIGVSILEAAAFGIGKMGFNCALFAAGRGEVFAQNFIFKENQTTEAVAEPWSAKIEEVIAKNSEFQNLNWIAPPEKLLEIKSANDNLHWGLTPFPENLAIFIGQLAHRQRLTNPTQISSLNPLYVRNADVG